MKITQISNNRGIIIKSSIKKVIIDGDVENASAFKDVVISHLSINTLNIIESNNSPYCRINLSFELMQLLQKLWQNRLIKKPKVMPKFRILPINVSSILGLEFRVTPFKNDDGIIGSLALVIEDVGTGEKVGYVPNFITQGQHKSQIKNWKKHFRNYQLDQLIIFNNNSDTQAKKVTYSEKDFGKDLLSHLNNREFAWVQRKLVPFNPDRLMSIQHLANEKNISISWVAPFARLLHYYFPNEKFIYQKDSVLKEEQKFFKQTPSLIANDNFSNDTIIINQSDNFTTLIQELDRYRKMFQNTLPENDLTEILKIIGAQETYLI